VKFSGSGSVFPARMEIPRRAECAGSHLLDGQGMAWVSDTGSQSVIKLDNGGNILSARRAFHLERGLLRWDLCRVAGNVWMGTQGGVAVVEMNNSGTGDFGTRLCGYGFRPLVVAFDGSGNAWTNTGLGHLCLGTRLNTLRSEFKRCAASPSGDTQTASRPGIVGGLNIICLYWAPNAFALDGAGNVWSEAVWIPG